jgi:hypothetical protein
MLPLDAHNFLRAVLIILPLAPWNDFLTVFWHHGFHEHAVDFLRFNNINGDDFGAESACITCLGG